MKILYLAHRIPYPPNKGDKIRSFNEIKYLSDRHEIHLACLADDPGDLRYKADLEEYCKTVTIVSIKPRLAKLKSIFFLFSSKPLSVPYFYSFRLQKSIDHLLSTNHFDCIFCFSSPMAEYVFRSKFLVSRFSKLGKSHVNESPETSNQQLKLIMDFVDVDSDKWAQYAKYTRFPRSSLYRLESRRLSAYERKVSETFDHSIFVTQPEVEVFKAANPHIQNVTAIPNGVDLDYFSLQYFKPQSSNLQPAAPILLFTGAMDYYANIDGVVWFSKEIFPLIKKEVPEAEFYVVGSNPTEEVKTLSNNDGIKVTGYVPDTREYLKKGTVAVVPLRIARGIQNKILEAMAMGLPVVTTSQALEGICAEAQRDVVVEDEPGAFSRAVLEVLKNPSLRSDLRCNARKCIEGNYCWTKNLSKLNDLISQPDTSTELSTSTRNQQPVNYRL